MKTTPEKIIREIESVIKNKDIKTSLFLMAKISSIAKKYRKINEPKIQNTLNYITDNLKLQSPENLKKTIETRIRDYWELRDSSKITQNILSKIRNSSVVFLYGNPKLAKKSLREAKERGIRFSVITTDSGPKNSGRIAANELSKSKIAVKHIPDFLICQAIKNADLVLFEAQAALQNKIIADLGAEQVVNLARENHIPAYCYIDIFSIDRSGNLREEHFEEDKKPKKQNPTMINKTKSAIDAGKITAAITQSGILEIKDLIKSQ